jgi:uncharacterized protein YutE (UPF0331/DUF86 family)
MYDLERISLIIDDVNMYIGKIEGMKLLSMKNIDDLHFDACSMNCFSLLNKLIDLSEEIVRGREMGTPFKYRDLFDILASANVIDEKMAKEIGDLIILRNRFSHRYDAIKEKELLNFIKNIGKIKNFVKCIEGWVRK